MKYALSPKRIYVLAEIGHKTSGFGNLQGSPLSLFSRLDREIWDQISDEGFIPPIKGVSEITGFIQNVEANGFLSSFHGFPAKYVDKYTNKHEEICCRNDGKHDVFPVLNSLTVNREILKKPSRIRAKYVGQYPGKSMSF